MKNTLKIVAGLALSALCLTTYAQTMPPAGTMPDNGMRDGKMNGKMKPGKMHGDKAKMKDGKMKDDMGKTKMSDDKMKTKM